MGDDRHTLIRIVRIDGGCSLVKVRDSDTVAELKARLLGCELASGSPTHLRLLFAGKELPDDRSLISLGIGLAAEGTPSLYAIDDSRAQQSMSSLPSHSHGGVRVQIISGKTLNLEAREKDTIRSLKQSLGNMLGVPVDHLCLIFAGRELRDTSDLESEGITTDGESTLYLLLRHWNPGGAYLRAERMSSPCTEFRPVAGRPKQAPAETAVLGEKVPSQSHSAYAKGSGFSVRAIVAKAQDSARLPKAEGMTDVAVDDLVERQLDGVWYEARVMKADFSGKEALLDLKYFDDGKFERGVAAAECRLVCKGMG